MWLIPLLTRNVPLLLCHRHSSPTRITMAAKTTQSHYEAHSSSSYESAFFYEPGAYTSHLCKLTQERLGLLSASSKRRLLDIGGGTGNFTRMLLEGCQKNVEAIVVDPFLEEGSTETGNKDTVQFVKAGAESFANPEDCWWKKDYHQVLMKEVVHHLDSSDREPIFRGIRKGLVDLEPSSSSTAAPLPALLVITRPQRNIDYPLWSEAREVWAANQPSLDDFKSELVGAGFKRVEHTIEAYPCDVELDRWLGMVRARFWSTFSNFSDKELEEACQRIKRDEAHRVDKSGRIHFEDRLLFISAYANE